MLLFLIFLLIAGFAVVRAEGMWRLWNVLIILGSCCVGFFVAYFASMWGRNAALGGQLVVPCTLVFGALGAVFCPRKKAPKTESSS